MGYDAGAVGILMAGSTAIPTLSASASPQGQLVSSAFDAGGERSVGDAIVVR